MERGIRLDTMSFDDNKRDTQKIPMPLNVEGLTLRCDCQYDTASAGIVRLYDGYATQYIDEVILGQGNRKPIRFYGKDIYWLHWWLNNNKPNFTPVTTATSQVDQKVSDRFYIPVGFALGEFSELKLEVESGVFVNAIGSGYSRDSFNLNGEAEYTTKAVKSFKLIPHTESNKTGTFKVWLSPEGKLSQCLIISRANASPYGRRDAVDTIAVYIEGDWLTDIEWEECQQKLQDITDEAYETGVGLILLESLPAIGNNSFLEIQADSTATDFVVYGLYEPYTAEKKAVAEVTPRLEQITPVRPAVVERLGVAKLLPPLTLGRRF